MCSARQLTKTLERMRAVRLSRQLGSPGPPASLNFSVSSMTYPCPCCGYLVFNEPPGSYGICGICFWEDDAVQLAFPDLAGGANKCSLMDGQVAYEKYGACEQRFVSHI